MPSALLTVFRFLIPSAFLLASTPHSLAQGAEDKSSTVNFRVTRFDPDDRESPKFKAGSGTSKTDVEVPLTYIAGPFKATLRDARFLDLWDATPGEKPAMSVEIAAAERDHLLLVFFPDGDKYRVMKVNASPTRIKGGDRFIINTTPHELAIKLGNADPVAIPSAKTGLLSAPVSTRPVSLPVVVNLKQDGEWKLASTEDWPCDPRFRKYLIAHMSPRTRQLAFHSLSELSE
jgi:hypothetical protein